MSYLKEPSVSDSFNYLTMPRNPADINWKQVAVQAGLIVVGVSVFAILIHTSTKNLINQIVIKSEEMLKRGMNDHESVKTEFRQTTDEYAHSNLLPLLQ